MIQEKEAQNCQKALQDKNEYLNLTFTVSTFFLISTFVNKINCFVLLYTNSIFTFKNGIKTFLTFFEIPLYLQEVYQFHTWTNDSFIILSLFVFSL